MYSCKDSSNMLEPALLVWLALAGQLVGICITINHVNCLMGAYLLKQRCAMGNWVTRAMNGAEGVPPSNNASMIQLRNIQCQHTTQQMLLKRVLLHTRNTDSILPV